MIYLNEGQGLFVGIRLRYWNTAVHSVLTTGVILIPPAGTIDLAAFGSHSRRARDKEDWIMTVVENRARGGILFLTNAVRPRRFLG